MLTFIIIIASIAIILALYFSTRSKSPARDITQDPVENVKINQVIPVEEKKDIVSCEVPQFDFIAVDFEYADHRQFACQVGIVPVLDGKIFFKISMLIQPPGNAYGYNEMAIHGINPAATRNSPIFPEIWDRIKPYFDNQMIVCHGASTDITVLKKTCEHYQIELPAFKVVDTIKKIGKYKLSQLADAYEIKYEKQHDALTDAFVLAQIYIQFLNGVVPETIQPVEKKEPKKLFAEKKIKKELLVKDLEVENKDNPFFDKRIVITGTFEGYDRNVIAEKLKSLGADINTAISAKTNFVLMGDAAGPAKTQKCVELNANGASIRILGIDDLNEIFVDNFKNL